MCSVELDLGVILEKIAETNASILTLDEQHGITIRCARPQHM
jgi:hypothetical protein